MSDLKTSTIKGLQWAGISQVFRQGCRLIIAAVLSRILEPADYGLLGMAMVFTGFASIFSTMGFSAALIQQKEVEPRHLQSVFSLNIMMGALLAGLTIGAAPLIAHFYREPRLTLLLSVLAGNFIIICFNSIPSIVLTREMRFRSIAVRNMSADIVAGIAAIIMAWQGWGVWSLVAQILLGSLVGAILVWRMVPIRPTCSVDWKALKELWKFSSYYMGSNIVGYWSYNADSMLVGKFLGKIDMGIYSRAVSLMMLPLQQISMIVSQVMFPALSKIQDDHERFRRAFLKSLRMLAFLTFPLMLGLLAAANPFVLVLCGPKWLAVVPVFKLMCFVGLAKSIGTTTGWVLTSQGRSDLSFKWSIASTVALVAASVIGLQWGIMGVAACYGIMYALLWYPVWRMTGGIIGLGFGTIMQNLAAIALVSVVMTLALMGLDLLLPEHWLALVRLAIMSAVGVAVYVTIMFISRNATLADWMDFLENTKLGQVSLFRKIATRFAA
jgi:PST family polysaccharide transporter